MVVEHTFITTLSAPDALRLASQFLSQRGFVATAQEAFAIGAGDAWNVLEMTRGKKNSRRAKSIVEYPQTLRLEWDRGRVSVAASATSYQEARSDYFGAGRVKGKAAQYQRQMLLDLVTRLQQLLEQQADPPQLATQWMAAENALHATDRRRRVRNVWIAVTIVFVFIAGLIGLGILAANKRW